MITYNEYSNFSLRTLWTKMAFARHGFLRISLKPAGWGGAQTNRTIKYVAPFVSPFSFIKHFMEVFFGEWVPFSQLIANVLFCICP